ncbi:MAG: MotA/TolQ/ExbB proton channel family protein [Bryobacteraceae bacterium]
MDTRRQMGEARYARQVLGAAERAMARAAAVTHEDLKRSLNTVATLTCLAPLIGMLGTVWAISFDTFRGLGAERSIGLAMVAEGLSRSLVPTALGLLIGIQSLWCHRYLRGRLEEFDREMAGASLDLINRLALRFDQFRPARPIEGGSHRVLYLEAYAPELAADTRFERRSYFATGVMLFITWWVEMAAYFEFDLRPLSSAFRAGLGSVVITFCCAGLPVYGVWVSILHRKPATVVPMAASFCFIWSVAGLFVPAIRF